MTKSLDFAVRTSGHTRLLLVCAKCSRKIDGGFGSKGKRSLADALVSKLRKSGQRGLVRVVETRCLSLCPDDGVTVISSDNPAEMIAVGAGTPTAEVLRRLAPASD